MSYKNKSIRKELKLRANAKWLKLSSEQRTQLIIWLRDDSVSYREAVKLCKERLGVHMSMYNVYDFFHRFVAPFKKSETISNTTFRECFEQIECAANLALSKYDEFELSVSSKILSEIFSISSIANSSKDETQKILTLRRIVFGDLLPSERKCLNSLRDYASKVSKNEADKFFAVLDLIKQKGENEPNHQI